jgi:DNA primase
MSMLDYDKLAEELDLQGVYYGGEDGKWLRACCPLHNEARPSFGIAIDSGVWKCFVCGYGTVDDLVSRIQGTSRDDAREWLKDVCALDEEALMGYLRALRKKHKAEEERINRSFSEAHLMLFRTKKITRFQTLFDRGFTFDTLEHLEVGYDLVRKRITFPVRDMRGNLVGITGRALKKDAELRWKIYWKYAKSNYLYHAHDCIKNAPLAVVEGPLDAARFIQFGWKNVVALQSAHPSKNQLALIRSLSPQYVLAALDNDYAGEMGTRILLDNILDECPVFYANYPKGVNDPGEATARQFDYMISKKKNAVISRIYSLNITAKWNMLT